MNVCILIGCFKFCFVILEDCHTFNTAWCHNPGDHNQLQHWFVYVVLYAHILSLKCTDIWPSMQYAGFCVYLLAISVPMPSQRNSGHHEM